MKINKNSMVATCISPIAVLHENGEKEGIKEEQNDAGGDGGAGGHTFGCVTFCSMRTSRGGIFSLCPLSNPK